MNPQLRKTREKYIDIPNTISMESLCQLEIVGIIELLKFNKQLDYMKPF